MLRMMWCSAVRYTASLPVPQQCIAHQHVVWYRDTLIQLHHTYNDVCTELCNAMPAPSSVDRHLLAIIMLVQMYRSTVCVHTYALAYGYALRKHHYALCYGLIGVIAG